ncbi:hypothetical protein D3C84_1098880 [compost metagenome]
MALGNLGEVLAQCLDAVIQSIAGGSRPVTKHNIGFIFIEALQERSQQTPATYLHIMYLHDPCLVRCTPWIDVFPERLCLPIDNPYRHRVRPLAITRHDMQLIDRMIRSRPDR